MATIKEVYALLKQKQKNGEKHEKRNEKRKPR